MKERKDNDPAYDMELKRLLNSISAAPTDIEKSNRGMTVEDIEVELRRTDLEIRKEELESAKQDRDQRGKFSKWIFIFVCTYMGIVLVILILCGYKCMALDDSVIISLLTTTTANIISIFLIVTKYLFYHK